MALTPTTTASGARSATAKPKSTKKTATKASGAGTKTKKTTVRKKKTTSKASTAAANQATWNAARSSQAELANQRTQQASKLSDPLWYQVEDLLPATNLATPMASNFTVLPEQTTIVEAALGHSGLTRSTVTPQAFACLLEQARRHAIEILADSQDFAYSANRSEITRADLQFASEMRADNQISVTAQLPKLRLIAQHINRAPLPPIPTQCYNGVLLPPRHHQVTARTFDVVSGARVQRKLVQRPAAAPTIGGKKSKPSYGAGRGRQISVNLKKTVAEAKPSAASSPASVQSKPTEGGTATTEGGTATTAATAASTAAPTATTTTPAVPMDTTPDGTPGVGGK